jgi:hypothetical protein
VIGVVVVRPLSVFDHPARFGQPQQSDLPTLESGMKGSSNFNAKITKSPHRGDLEDAGGLGCKLCSNDKEASSFP